MPDRAQSVPITSTDGHSFTVVGTPRLPSEADGAGFTESHLEWTGEPAFSINFTSMTRFWGWSFKVVAPGRAEVSYLHNPNYIVAACTTDRWTGVLTRDH